MHSRSPRSISWPEVLARLRTCSGELVLIRDGRETAPAADVRSRPAAKGTELCLFPGDAPSMRVHLIEQLAALSKNAGRRFVTSARARINDSSLVVEGVADETIDGVLYAVVTTRRPKLGYNQSLQTGASTTLRTKRIKTG